jgi:D-amino-acid dehydrogenase
MRKVCVVGAGVVGVTTAWYLAEAGWKVTLLDKTGAVGLGTSFQNGGQLSYRYVSPLADRDAPFKGLKWMLEKDGALRFKPSTEWAQWSWMAQFLWNCRTSVNRKTTERLACLGVHSRGCMTTLMASHQLPDFDWKESGKLIVYRTPSGFEKASSSGLIAGVQSALSAQACIAKEPVLASLEGKIAGGIFTTDEAVADCYQFCESLLTLLKAHPNFEGVVAEEALRFERDGSTRVRLHTKLGVRTADAFVLASGIASRRLAATVAVRLPLYPLKGYSLTAPIGIAHTPPTTSITDFDKKILYARIGDQLRVAAMVDMVGEDERIDAVRIASLMRVASTDMPTAGDYAQATHWAGLRPATPGGAPIVGACGVPGLWLNVGHGPLGFTFACGTASMLSSLMDQRESAVPLDGLTIS